MNKWLQIVIVAVAIPALSYAQGGESDYQAQVRASLAPRPHGLTATEAARSAREKAPEVAIADAEVEASIASTRKTLSRYVPNVTVSGSIFRRNSIDFDFGAGGFSVGALNEGVLQVGNCPDGTTGCIVDSQGQPVGAVAPTPFEIPKTTYSVDVSLTVPLSDYVLALSPAKKGAEASEKAARFNREAQLRTVGVNARIAFYDFAKAIAQVAVAEQNLSSSEAELEDARMGLEAGTVTSADALGLEGSTSSAKVALAQAQSFLRLAEQNLRIRAHLDEDIELGEDMWSDVDSLDKLGTLDELLSRAKTERSEVKAVLSSRKASEFASKGAKAAIYPRLDAVGNVTHANPNQAFFPPTAEWNTSWNVGLQLSWRLDGFLNSRSQVRELDANVEVLRAQYENMLRGIEMEVRGAWEEYLRADKAQLISETELVAAEAMLEQRQILFRGGEATSTDVSMAELARANATLRNVQSRIDKRIALVKLRRAAALPMEEQ